MSLEMFEEYICECDCEFCQRMCHVPCTGTPDDIQNLIDAGYGDRLCCDDFPGDMEKFIKPALKGYEAKEPPFETMTFEGCTFWKNGKCELHDKGLKPLQGKIAHHNFNMLKHEKYLRFFEEVWGSQKGQDLIKYWQEEYLNKNN